MDITLTLNGRDFSGRVSTYSVNKSLEQVRTITTIDGTEHVLLRSRDVITFSLIPYSDSEASDDYTALKVMEFSATYTDPYANTTVTKTVRVASDLKATFGIKSINGNRYYKGGDIVLRAVGVNA